MNLYDALQLAFKSNPATQNAIVNQLSDKFGANPILVANFRNSLKSHTTMFVVNEDGGLTTHSIFENAWGSAMLVWEYMTIKYFPTVSVNQALHDQDHLRRVWALADDASIPMCERAALLSTFDGAMCGHDHLPRLSALFMEFSDLCSVTFPTTRANTLPEQAHAMTQIYESGWQAICWQQTNWRPPTDPPEWSKDYNIHTDEKHWFIEDRLEWANIN